MSQRFAETFKKVRDNNKMALIPYVIGCDPSFDLSLKIMHTLATNGADALNIGFAFSDPGTAGEAVLVSNKRALTAGSSSDTCFELIKKFRQTDKSTAIAVTVYANALVVYGVQAFFQSCHDCGIDAVFIPDLPYIMLQVQMHNFKKAADSLCSLILSASSNLTQSSLKDIAACDVSYIYALSDVKVGGDRISFTRPESLIKTLKAATDTPVVVGKGVGSCEDIQELYALGVDGVVVGSVFSLEIKNNLSDEQALLESIAKKSALLSRACCGPK